MKILLSGFLLSILLILCHLVILKLTRMNNIILESIFVFFAVFLAGSGILLYSHFLLTNLATITYVFLLYASLTGVYLFHYLNMVDQSPSMSILLTVDGAGTEGLEKTELINVFSDELIKSRLQKLFDGKLIRKNKEQYGLTPIGIWIVSFYILHRRMMGLSYLGG